MPNANENEAEEKIKKALREIKETGWFYVDDAQSWLGSVQEDSVQIWKNEKAGTEHPGQWRSLILAIQRGPGDPASQERQEWQVNYRERDKSWGASRRADLDELLDLLQQIRENPEEEEKDLCRRINNFFQRSTSARIALQARP